MKALQLHIPIKYNAKLISTQTLFLMEIRRLTQFLNLEIRNAGIAQNARVVQQGKIAKSEADTPGYRSR